MNNDPINQLASAIRTALEKQQFDDDSTTDPASLIQSDLTFNEVVKATATILKRVNKLYYVASEYVQKEGKDGNPIFILPAQEPHIDHIYVMHVDHFPEFERQATAAGCILVDYKVRPYPLTISPILELAR